MLPWGFFLHLLKIKTNPRGVREPGQHRIRVWEQRGHLASLRHPVSPSYHTKSVLFFQPGFLSPSSYCALPSLTLFLLPLAGKEENLTAVWQSAFAALPMWGWRLETLPGVNSEKGGGVKLLPKRRSLGEGTFLPAALLAVGITALEGTAAG